MKLLIVLAAFVAYAAADIADDCGPMQRLKVKGAWAHIYSTHKHRIEFSTEVWKEFFHRHPEAVALFERVNGKNIYSSEFRAHMERVLGGLDSCIDLFDDPEALDEELAHLKHDHESRPGTGDHIEDFLQSLLDVISHEDLLCFDQHAWDACLHIISKGIFG